MKLSTLTIRSLFTAIYIPLKLHCWKYCQKKILAFTFQHLIHGNIQFQKSVIHNLTLSTNTLVSNNDQKNLVINHFLYFQWRFLRFYLLGSLDILLQVVNWVENSPFCVHKKKTSQEAGKQFSRSDLIQSVWLFTVSF